MRQMARVTGKLLECSCQPTSFEQSQPEVPHDRLRQAGTRVDGASPEDLPLGRVGNIPGKRMLPSLRGFADPNREKAHVLTR